MKTLWFAFLGLLLSAPVFSFEQAMLLNNQSDYNPGDTVKFEYSGAAKNEHLVLSITEQSGDYFVQEFSVDAVQENDGVFHAFWVVPSSVHSGRFAATFKSGNVVIGNSIEVYVNVKDGGNAHFGNYVIFTREGQMVRAYQGEGLVQDLQPGIYIYHFSNDRETRSGKFAVR